MTLKPFSKNGGSTRDAFNKKVAKIFEISLHIPSLCMAMYVGVITFYCTPCMYVAFKSFQMSLENKTGKQIVLRTISLHRYPTLQLMNCKWSPLNNLHPQDTKRPQKNPRPTPEYDFGKIFRETWLAVCIEWSVTGHRIDFRLSSSDWICFCPTTGNSSANKPRNCTWAI